MDGSSTNINNTQYFLTRYGMTIYVILGNIGLFFNINIFSQSSHRRNSSSLYLLSMTICNILSLNFGTIPYIYALNHNDLLTTSLMFCKLQFYFRHVPNQMMRTFIILACINRYISSNIQHRFQFFNQYQFTIRCITFVIIFWLIICLFIPILSSIKNGICGMMNIIPALIYSIYLLIFAGIIPPLVMIISSLLLIYNLKKIRIRINPIGNKIGLMRKRDRDYIRMLLVEILIYILTTIPFTLTVFYITIQQLDIKNYVYHNWQLTFIFITRLFLVYLNNSLSFWIYILMSKSFRNEFKDLLSKWYIYLKNIIL